MVWIERNLRLFQSTSAVCAILSAAIVLWFSVSPARAFHMTRMQLGLIAMPWLVGFVAFTPLLFVSLSKGVTSTTRKILIRAFIALFFAAVVVIFAGIYGHFVFQLF